MTRWKEDVTRHCNEIYENTPNLEKAESILELILTGGREEIESFLTNPDNADNKVLLSAIFALDQMHRYPGNCIQATDPFTIDNFVLELEQTMVDIKYDKRIEVEDELDLEDELESTTTIGVSGGGAAASDERDPSTSVESSHAELPSRKHDKRIESEDDLGLEDEAEREHSEPLSKKQQLDVSGGGGSASDEVVGPSTSVQSPRAELPSRHDSQSNQLFNYIMQKPEISPETKEDIRRKFAEITHNRPASLDVGGY